MTQNMNGNEIYRKILQTFGKKLFVWYLHFHRAFQLFSNRFHYHLGFERLNKVWRYEWHNWTQLPLVISCSYCCHRGYIHHIKMKFLQCSRIPNIKHFFDLMLIRYIFHDLYTSKLYLLIIPLINRWVHSLFELPESRFPHLQSKIYFTSFFGHSAFSLPWFIWRAVQYNLILEIF